MKSNNRQYGFTLVELSLAMATLSVLLLFIAMLTLQVTKIYNKGMTLRAADEAGQLIIQDMKNSIKAVAPGDIKLSSQDAWGISGGRLCVGNTIYAWNKTGDSSPGSGDVFGWNAIGTDYKKVRLVKFKGNASVACSTTSWTVDIKSPAMANTEQADLLSPGDTNLYVKDMDIDATSGTGVVKVSFVLSTNTSDLIQGDTCQPNAGGGDEFCAINQFTFTARAGSKGE